MVSSIVVFSIFVIVQFWLTKASGNVTGVIININGMDVLVFKQNEQSTIMYIDGLTYYDIDLHCDFETAKEFAQTIK